MPNEGFTLEAMKFAVMPDSFKGALSAGEATAAITRGLLRAIPDAQISTIPMADGGEGTVEAMLAAHQGEHGDAGESTNDFPRRVSCKVSGPHGPTAPPVVATYALLDEATAVIEMAAAAGLPLMGENRDVENSTTYGVGELIRDAVDNGATRILIGAGGSATNDLGCGAVAALGAVFRDASGEEVLPTGATLADVHSLDLSGIPDAITAASITVLADIDNPILGPRGCAAIFAPQKGADAECVARLEAGAEHLTEVVARSCGTSIADLPGAGAAGGFAGGLVATLGAEIRPGIDALLEAVGFDSLAAGVDAIITAEGQIDGQSLSGKVPVGIARRAGGTPVFVLAGSVGVTEKNSGAASAMQPLYDAGITAIFTIGQRPEPLHTAIAGTAGNLETAAENLARTLAAHTSNER